MFVKKESSNIAVSVSVVDPETGETGTFTARWKLYPVDDGQAKIEQIRAGEIGDQALLDADLVAIEGITDDQGEAVADDAELREWLMRWPHTRGPLMRSWYSAQAGLASAAQKN